MPRHYAYAAIIAAADILMPLRRCYDITRYAHYYSAGVFEARYA